jgi:TRAP-type mannitol/chloroaromatic compound transport system permease small subunit
MYAGWGYGHESWRIQEVSVNSPVGVPIWQLKLMIPFAAFFLALQGVAEVLRCVVCLRKGAWPARLHDVEELEIAVAQQHAQEQTAAKGGGK